MIHFEYNSALSFQIYVQLWYQVSQIPMQIENQWFLMVEGEGRLMTRGMWEKDRIEKGKENIDVRL